MTEVQTQTLAILKLAIEYIASGDWTFSCNAISEAHHELDDPEGTTYVGLENLLDHYQGFVCSKAKPEWWSKSAVWEFPEEVWPDTTKKDELATVWRASRVEALRAYHDFLEESYAKQ